jgi:pyruvate-ferredoxin/flavodoxin oxidoreductase
VRKNIEAVDQTLANLFEVTVPDQITSAFELPDPFTADAPNRIKETLGRIYGGLGETLPVSIRGMRHSCCASAVMNSKTF